MGKVTENLFSQIKRQVDDHGLVVWYDPEKAYLDAVKDWPAEHASLILYDNSFLQVREMLEPYLEYITDDNRISDTCGIPPRVLIYLPMAGGESLNALVEAETAGVIMEPAADCPERNTRLKFLAEKVFREMAPDRAEDVVKKVEEGVLSLKDLELSAEQVVAVGTGALPIIFKTSSFETIIMKYLASDEWDGAIDEKKAMTELAEASKKHLGLDINCELSPADVRRSLRRKLLLCDYISYLSADMIPQDLVALIPELTTQQITLIQRVCKTWRDSVGLRDDYASGAKVVEGELNLSAEKIPAAIPSEAETFPCIEEAALKRAEQLLVDGDVGAATEIVSNKRNSFWSMREPIYSFRWSLIDIGVKIIGLHDRVLRELGPVSNDSGKLVIAYVAGDSPWCELDSLYRHFERRQVELIDMPLNGTQERQERILKLIRKKYTEVVGKCAEAFIRSLESNGFDVKDINSQDKVFSANVMPSFREGKKIAYLLTDGLRYEMGRELIAGLGPQYDASIEPVLAQLPSITDIGMACLLPGAERSLEISDTGRESFNIKVNGTTVMGRTERIKYLLKIVGEDSLVLKLNDLMRLGTKRKSEISDAKFLVVTSQEIDRLGEDAEDEGEAHQYMTDVLEKLRIAIRRLIHLGFEQVIVTADHGYLFGEDIGSSMKIDPPGGNTVALYRRAWIGRGGREDSAYLRVPVSMIGLEGDLECAFPRGLACFSTRGSSSAYVHSGISLQEMVIPVIVLKPKELAVTGGKALVLIEMEREIITNRFFSVVLKYVSTDFYLDEEIRVKVSIMAGNKEVGNAVMAAYGFADDVREISLIKEKPNAITFMLSESVSIDKVSIRVIDASNDIVIESKKDIPVKLCI